jgi:phospholipase/lecithinase/hemolysin
VRNIIRIASINAYGILLANNLFGQIEINSFLGDEMNKKLMKATLATTLTLAFGASAQAASIYFFGDSLTDTGNTSAAFGGAVPAYTPGTPYETGQYTNDTAANTGVWSSQFAARMGASAIRSTAGGTNYSWAGAKTFNDGGLPGINTQVSTYIAATSATSSANDLYVIMIGGNDVGAGLASPDPGLAIQQGLTNIANAVQSLYADGARHFLVANMPDVAATPYIRFLGTDAINGSKFFANAWNAGWTTTMNQLSALPGIDLDRLDFTALSTYATANASALGFTNTTDTCFVSTQPVQPTLQDCNKFFYSDNFHPTVRAHSLIADFAVAAVPAPGALTLMGLGLAGLVATRRKQK